MAEAVQRRLVEDAGMADRVEVDSAGTGDWHIGERADRRAVDALLSAGYPDEGHRARQFDVRWFAGRDLVVALDRGHLRTLQAWAPGEVERAKVHLLRSFDTALASGTAACDLDIADPYYDGPAKFAEVLEQIETACAGLLTHVREQLGDRALGDVAAS